VPEVVVVSVDVELHDGPVEAVMEPPASNVSFQEVAGEVGALALLARTVLANQAPRHHRVDGVVHEAALVHAVADADRDDFAPLRVGDGEVPWRSWVVGAIQQ
jgi:hypothetical protein